MGNCLQKKAISENQQSLIFDYCNGCRFRLEEFLKTEYTLKRVWEIQRKKIVSDLWKLSLNSIWAVFYLSLKKISESIDKVGWSLPLSLAENLPSGFKTTLQAHFEKKIASQLFEIHEEHDIKMNVVKKELKKYAAGRTIVASFSTTLTTLTLGWLLFGVGNLNLFNLINKISQMMALDRASSNFIFGKGLGKAFYHFVPPHVSALDIFFAAVLVFLNLAIVGFFLSIIYFPIRKEFHFEKKKISKMIDEIEDRLILEAYRCSQNHSQTETLNFMSK